MKIGRLVALGILTVGLAVNGADAHASSFRADVPFSFVVGNQTLPRGTYIVQRLLAGLTALDPTGVVVIKTRDHRIYRTVITRLRVDRPADRAGGSKLLFTTFQGRRYLSQVRVAGDRMADQIDTPADSDSLGARSIREVKLVSLR